MFVDTAQIEVTAGKGGDGRVSFRREKFVPKGGPDGGDGASGGNVVIKVDPSMATLMDFRAKPTYKAQDGQMGGSSKMTGADGDDLIINVPQGTLVYQVGDEELLIGDMVEKDQTLIVAHGGIGGKGNTRFKSSTNQTPMQFTPGGVPESKTLKLEIKLIADVGLIGFPNAGKSTLINKLAGTKAKVAGYEFTTLSPNLGVCKLKDGNKIILADVPGLIEGASEGKGLGDDFLRHVERTRLLVHLVDPYTHDEDMIKKATNAYKAIRTELKNYGAGLEEKQEIAVINKIDITEIKQNLNNIIEEFNKYDVEIFGISAVTGEGLEKLLDTITQRLASIPKQIGFETTTPTKVFTIDNLPNRRMVFRGR